MSHERKPQPGAYAIERLDGADTEGLSAFVAVHEEAATWLWDRGVKQWRPGEFTVQALHRVLDNGGEVYLARREGAPAGGFTLQWEDVAPWGERAPNAGYLHALCVRRADAGTGLGATLLDYAGERVAEMGRAWLRLDCWSGNDTLRAYYERLGFTLRGLAAEHGFHVALYERPSTTTPPLLAGEGARG